MYWQKESMLPLNIKETQAYNNYWEHVLLDRDHHIRGNWLFVLFCSITLFVITQYLRNIANRNQRRYFNLEQVWKQICQYSDNALSLFPGILKHFCSDNHRKPRIFAFKVAIFFMEFAVCRQVGRQVGRRLLWLIINLLFLSAVNGQRTQVEIT